ncbi:MAG: Fic family protein [Anaerolineae bacterium]|nr:Fic family protein [Anaerolineae bacterium]
MAALGRYQGRQELFRHQAPQVLDVLRRTAIVESTEASNRIEGIVVPPHRLEALMSQEAPQTRSESEIAGYRDVLARVHTGQIAMPLTPESIRALHAELYAFLPGEGGEWKDHDNVIRQRLPDGRDVVRFVPLPAVETPQAMAELCAGLTELWNGEAVDQLLVANAFVLDFLCIHPFRDGNGRVGRLLTLVLLYAAGYEVGRYISLERIIEHTKETYYEALWRSSQRWETGKHDLTPWHQYSLSVLIYAYREFEARVGELASAPGAKREAVLQVFGTLKAGQTFSIAEMERLCPTVSRATVRRVLEELREQRAVECLGTGRAAQWRKC